MSKNLVARWATRGKKYWYELYEDDMGFTYTQDHGGGNLGGNITVEEAIAQIEKMIDHAKQYDNINYQRVS